MKGYPAYFRKFLCCVLAALALSGIVIIPVALEMRLEWDAPWAVSGGLRIALHALHATAAFLALFIVGALWSVHIRAGWIRRENWRSGIAMLLLVAVLLASAIGMYYAGEERAGQLSVIVHLLAGLLVPVIFAAHLVGVRHAERRVKRGIRQRNGADAGGPAWRRSRAEFEG